MTESQHNASPEQPGRRRPRRPSLSTIIALIALVVATTSTAHALPGRNSVKSDDIQRGAVTTPKIRSGAVTAPKLRQRAVTTSKLRTGAVTPEKLSDHALWALVRANGTLVQGAGVEAVNHPAPGIYQVRFERRVTDRALTATIYSNGIGNGQVNVLHCDPAHPLGGTTLNPAFDVPACAFVNTEASDGTNTDNSFLVVALPLNPGVTTPAPRRVPRSGQGEASR